MGQAMRWSGFPRDHQSVEAARSKNTETASALDPDGSAKFLHQHREPTCSSNVLVTRRCFACQIMLAGRRGSLNHKPVREELRTSTDLV